jgi:NDP-sugar pyrophosphorylase family protein
MSIITVGPEMRVGAGVPLKGDTPRLSAAGFVSSSSRRAAVAVAEGIVLAGVHAWGDGVLDRVACWPLVPVAGRPLISHSLRWFRQAGLASASICANSDTVPVCRALRDGRSCGIGLEYYEDVLPRGPAGCTRDVMLDREATLFVVVEGSILPDLDLAELLAAHGRSGAMLTVVATTTCGRPASGRLVPVGVYVFSREVAETIRPLGFQDIKETLIPDMHERGMPVLTYLVENHSLPRVRCAASYLAVNKWATERISGDRELPAAYRVAGEARIHESARIDPHAKLIGPVLVDVGCVVEAGAVVVGPTTIGAGCRIARNAVISRSALWAGCGVGIGAILDDCVLIDESAVEDGAVLRNTVGVAGRPRRGRVARE